MDVENNLVFFFNWTLTPLMAKTEGNLSIVDFYLNITQWCRHKSMAKGGQIFSYCARFIKFPPYYKG